MFRLCLLTSYVYQWHLLHQNASPKNMCTVKFPHLYQQTFQLNSDEHLCTQHTSSKTILRTVVRFSVFQTIWLFSRPITQNYRTVIPNFFQGFAPLLPRNPTQLKGTGITYSGKSYMLILHIKNDNFFRTLLMWDRADISSV